MVKKISIVGVGAVGSTLGFHLVSRLQLDELSLIDISSDLAKGVACDLEDTRGFLNFNTKIVGTSDMSALKDSDIVIFTAGIARKDGMTRLDLLKINAKVAKDVSVKIKKFAPKSIVIAVTNPLDVITYVITKATKFPRCRVIGMGSLLDTSRFLNIIHKETGISTSSIEGYVFGMHSKDMIATPERVRVNGEKLSTILSKDKMAALKERVQLRGAEIVGYLKTRSANFAPSLAVCSLVEAIAYNKNQIIPAAVMLNGEYGLKDLCVGVPCVIGRKGIERIVEIDLTKSERAELKQVKELFKQCMTLL